MLEVYIQPAARQRIRDIHAYSLDLFGPDQADTYVDGLLREIENLPQSTLPVVPIPKAFGVEGFMVRFESHRVYWYWEKPGELIVVVSILHAQMDQLARFLEDMAR